MHMLSKRASNISAHMTDNLNKALDAIAKHQTNALPDLRHGQYVVELGGDGSKLVGTSDVVTLPVSQIKPFEQPTYH
jgi:hypothetical protein